MLAVAFSDKIGEKIGEKSSKGATTGIFIVFIMTWFAGASVYGTFEVFMYMGFADNEIFLLIFGIILGCFNSRHMKN